MMRPPILPSLACAALLSAAAPLAAHPAIPATPAPPCKPTTQGDLRFHDLDSTIFGNRRTVRVLLPPGYDLPANQSRRYPVFYLLDGQNLFDACLSEVSHVEWAADETVYRLIAEKQIPPLIVVGVDHAGRDRAHEYLPYKDFVGDPYMPEPAGKRLPDFLVTEVMPLVNGRYRTLRGQPNTGIGGSSYAGVATLYALLARPGEFGYALIESPTLWVGMGQPVRDTSPLTAMPVKVFIGFGGREAGDPAINEWMVGFVRALESNFKAAGYDAKNLRFVLDPQAEHGETAWGARLPGALAFLFGEWRETPQPP